MLNSTTDKAASAWDLANSWFVAKIESEDPALRLAVLIDADNAQAAVIEGLLAEI